MTIHINALVYGAGPDETIQRAAEGLEKVGMINFKASKVTHIKD